MNRPVSRSPIKAHRASYLRLMVDWWSGRIIPWVRDDAKAAQAAADLAALS